MIEQPTLFGAGAARDTVLAAAQGQFQPTRPAPASFRSGYPVVVALSASAHAQGIDDGMTRTPRRKGKDMVALLVSTIGCPPPMQKLHDALVEVYKGSYNIGLLLPKMEGEASI